jgi:hypothetical protein
MAAAETSCATLSWSSADDAAAASAAAAIAAASSGNFGGVQEVQGDAADDGQAPAAKRARAD